MCCPFVWGCERYRLWNLSPLQPSCPPPGSSESSHFTVVPFAPGRLSAASLSSQREKGRGLRPGKPPAAAPGHPPEAAEAQGAGTSAVSGPARASLPGSRRAPLPRQEGGLACTGTLGKGRNCQLPLGTAGLQGVLCVLGETRGADQGLGGPSFFELSFLRVCPRK